MSSLLEFNSVAFDRLLDEYGLQQAWLNILATHLRDKNHLAYILESPEMKTAAMLDCDVIDGLSIGEVGVLYEYSVAREDVAARKSNGQFFTPDDVARFMVKFSTEFPEGIWLDPCSGIGNLSWHLVAVQQNPESFLLNSLRVSDRDALALLIARTLLVAEFQRERRNLFHDIADHFMVFDFLSVADSGVGTLTSNTRPLEQIPDHDYVIVNPPYLATVRDSRFETAKCADLYAYFLENIIKTSKGFISVTPQSFTNAGKFRTLRGLMLRYFSDLRIFNFDNVPGNIFRGIKFGSSNTNTANSIRAAITVALPGRGTPRITSLVRWQSAERARLFAEIEDFLSTVPLSEEYFPKVNRSFENLFNELDSYPRLEAICCKHPTEFPLHIPSSPRYFISALKFPVQRASQRTVFFNSSEDRNLAYLVINSSLMYWWWRVRDGGMTLSQETLLSVPLPGVKIDQHLVALLEESEKANKVYKKNAGSLQENVKHPSSLISQLNDLVCPSYADKLISTHFNSEFAQEIGHFVA